MGGLGSGGQNRKTKEEKLLTGTFRPDRHRTSGKPGRSECPKNGTPEKPPRGLTAEAKRLFKTVTDGWHLDDAGLFALARCCEILMRLREAQVKLKESGLTIINPKTGLEAAHPCVKMEKDNYELLLKWWKSLGLSIDIPVER